MYYLLVAVAEGSVGTAQVVTDFGTASIAAAVGRDGCAGKLLWLAITAFFPVLVVAEEQSTERNKTYARLSDTL